MDVARKSLIKSTKAGRIIARKILIALNKVRLAINLKGDNCQENIINSINNLVELFNEVEDKTCSVSSRTSTLKPQTTSQSCVPEQAANDFLVPANNAVDDILSALDIDNNQDSIPDLCGKTTRP